MNIMKIDNCSIANGTGVRVAVFVSGCNINCEGCHNQEAWDLNAGERMTADTVDNILELCEKPEIQGITILGGEPLNVPRNMVGTFNIINRFRLVFGDVKDVWVYTGMSLPQIMIKSKEETTGGRMFRYILDNTDVLVTEPFILSQKEAGLKFKGSRNQRIVDMKTGKYLFSEDN